MTRWRIRVAPGRVSGRNGPGASILRAFIAAGPSGNIAPHRTSSNEVLPRHLALSLRITYPVLRSMDTRQKPDLDTPREPTEQAAPGRHPRPTFLDALRGVQRPFLVAHVTPDVDALGAVLALAATLLNVSSNSSSDSNE